MNFPWNNLFVSLAHDKQQIDCKPVIRKYTTEEIKVLNGPILLDVLSVNMSNDCIHDHRTPSTSG